MKFIITAAVGVSHDPVGRRRVVTIETYELTGFASRADAEAAVMRACNNRCEIRSVTEEKE